MGEAIAKFSKNEVEAKFVDRVGDIDALDVAISEDSLRTILIQFEALGLIRKASLNASVTRWILTPYGEKELVKLYAIKKVQSPS